MIKFITITFLFIFHNAYSQQSFIKNIVKVKGTSGEYGFITGSDKKFKESFFITIDRNKKLPEKLNVLIMLSNNKHNKENITFPATLVQRTNVNSNYFISVYKIDNYIQLETKYYSPTSVDSNNYSIFNDYFRQDGSNLFDPSLSKSAKILSVDIYGRDILSQTITFLTERKGEFGLKNTPIIDKKGILKAIIADKQDNAQDAIKAIDITAIEKILTDLGKRDGNACKYFSLIEQGSYKDETPCQRLDRLNKEAEEKRLQLEKERISQLRQDSLKHVFDMYRQGSREREVVRIYNMHIDRPFAISIGGTGFATLLTMNVYPDASTSKTSASSFGYSLKGNFYLNPDKEHFRLVLKPRYTYTPFSVSENYNYAASNNFTLTQLNLKSYELTIMPELVFKRLEKGDNFFGIGYGIAKHTSTNFSYKLVDKIFTEPILGYRIYSRHAVAEIGSSRGRIRYSLVVRYELTSYLRDNYEFIVDGKSVFPLRDVSNHYWTYGVDFQLRLWNRWKNDYRTMF